MKIFDFHLRRPRLSLMEASGLERFRLPIVPLLLGLMIAVNVLSVVLTLRD